MSKIEVNQISSQCGSTLTVGQSGDTVTLASGATQTGFGRTGTVDWDTTAKTAGFTAVSGDGYFVNTTSGAVTMTLPATPSAGDIVSVKDYAYTFATNNLTVNRNGSPIGGGSDTDTITYSTGGDFLTFIYVDGTQGWVLTNDSTNIDSTGAAFIAATGGTETTCGDYKIHTFTGPGTFTVTSAGNSAGSDTVDYLVVAGGGGSGGDLAGGAGAGGYRFSDGTASGCYSAGPAPLGASALPVSIQGYPITVGSGGALASSPNVSQGNPGVNSTFSTITSAGGGGGLVRSEHTTSPSVGPGGSGGGATYNQGCFGAGNTPPVSPPQGNPGSPAPGTTDASGGGGGGAGGAGAAIPPAGSPRDGIAGGVGLTSCITGSPVARGGGGGGGGWGAGASGGGGGGSPGPSPGFGGGAGGPAPNNPGCAGVANTGGGAGGGFADGVANGNNGGSGIVIIRYKFQ